MNLFKKATASIALVALVSGVFTTGVSAYSTAEVEAANMLASKGIINTQADVANYNLGQNVLRQEIAKVAANMAGIDAKTSCDNSFADVTATTPNTWACSYVEALLDAGKVSANENFRPEDNISKSEAVKMVLEAAGYTGIYTDAAKWQEEVVAFAEENGVTTSFTNYNTPATRGFIFEAAANAVSANEEDDSDDILGDILGDLDEDTEEDMTEEEEAETPVVSGDNVLVVDLSPETPANGNVAAGVTRTAVLAFDVTAGSEDVVLKEATLEFTGLGDASDLEELAFYMGNDKVTKQDSRKFDSENEADLSFEKDSVVKAGETKTITVTATIKADAADELQTLRVSLASLEASTTVEGAELDGANLTPVKVSNKGTVEIKNDKASDDVVVGEEVSLAGFKLEETSDKEDVIVKSITFTVSGSIDAEDDISDLVLYADGEMVASDLTVNSDDEIIADLEYTIEADERVEFELKGTVTGSINETIEVTFVNNDDIYVVGAETGISLAVGGSTAVKDLNLANVETVEGSEINVSFDKSDIDEVKPNAEDVLVGTLTMSTDEDYTINTIEVTVVASTGSVSDIINTFELDGTSYDSVSGTGTAVYKFEDISLNDEEKVLDFTFDVEDNTALNGRDLSFTVKITEVEDEENDEKYTSTDVSKVLSSNSFDSKTIDVESASFELTASNVTNRELVLGNGIEVVLYKGKINVGDSDDVTVNDIEFKGSSNLALSGSSDLEDILDDVTLNIGGKTFDGDVNAANIEFTSVNAVIAAGSDNVEVLVTGILKDHDAINSGNILELEVDTTAIDLEDSEGESLESANVTTTAANTYNAKITLNEEGSFDLDVVVNGDNEDLIENVVLAGENGVALAEVELEAKDEDVKVKELSFSVSGSTDFTSTLDNVKLVAGSKTLAEGAVVTFGTGTIITFKNDFIIEESDDKIEAVLVADLNTVTTEGGEVSAQLGDIQIIANLPEAGDVKGVSSNEDLTVNLTNASTPDTITVVPALVTVSIDNKLGNEDQYGKIRFAIDKGNNDLDSDDVVVTQISLESAATGVVIRNDDNASITITDNNVATLALTANAEINNGDEFEFKVVNDNDEVRIVANGVSYTIDGKTYTISNDKVIDLGQYTTDNN